MADFLNKLEQTFLTEKRVVAASAVAWLLLLTINAYHSCKERLKDEKELLKTCIRQSGNKITFLVSQTASSLYGIFSLKLRTISSEGKKDLDQQDLWILVESKYKKKIKRTEMQPMDLGTSDHLEIRPVITQKNKENPRWTSGVVT